jgi:hypothetical protein
MVVSEGECFFGLWMHWQVDLWRRDISWNILRDCSLSCSDTGVIGDKKQNSDTRGCSQAISSVSFLEMWPVSGTAKYRFWNFQAMTEFLNYQIQFLAQPVIFLVSKLNRFLKDGLIQYLKGQGGTNFIFPFLSLLANFLTDYRCHSRTCPLFCFARNNSWFVTWNHQK